MRAVAYIRVSDASQVEGHSLDAQDRLFKEHCRKRGWDPLAIYREEGRSAHVDSIARRPVFRQLLEDASKDSFDVVVVHTLDRWARNTRVALEALGILPDTLSASSPSPRTWTTPLPKVSCSLPC